MRNYIFRIISISLMLITILWFAWMFICQCVSIKYNVESLELGVDTNILTASVLNSLLISIVTLIVSFKFLMKQQWRKTMLTLCIGTIANLVILVLNYIISGYITENSYLVDQWRIIANSDFWGHTTSFAVITLFTIIAKRYNKLETIEDKTSTSNNQSQKKVAIYILRGICIFIISLIISDIPLAITKPENYHFGTELGWSYRSMERYIISSCLHIAYIMLIIFTTWLKNNKYQTLILSILIIAYIEYLIFIAI